MSTGKESVIQRAGHNALKLGAYATAGLALVVLDEVYRDGDGMRFVGDVFGGIAEEVRDQLTGFADSVLSDMDVYQR
jgi:hypothetical protein